MANIGQCFELCFSSNWFIKWWNGLQDCKDSIRPCFNSKIYHHPMCFLTSKITLLRQMFTINSAPGVHCSQSALRIAVKTTSPVWMGKCFGHFFAIEKKMVTAVIRYFLFFRLELGKKSSSFKFELTGPDFFQSYRYRIRTKVDFLEVANSWELPPPSIQSPQLFAHLDKKNLWHG